MEFDKARIYTAVNADEVKVGSKGYFADNMADLEQAVTNEDAGRFSKVRCVNLNKSAYCFHRESLGGDFTLFYLVEESKEITAAEWDNKPRIMKVWNDDPEDMTHAKVVHILADADYPVIGVDAKETSVSAYRHCAEIAAALEARDEASEKSYRPYNNAKEFISDYKKRFCPDCKGIPAIWVKSKSKAGALKQVIRIDNDIVIDDIITNGVWIATDRFFDFEDFFNTYTYPDGSPAGAEI